MLMLLLNGKPTDLRYSTEDEYEDNEPNHSFEEVTSPKQMSEDNISRLRAVSVQGNITMDHGDKRVCLMVWYGIRSSVLSTLDELIHTYSNMSTMKLFNDYDSANAYIESFSNVETKKMAIEREKSEIEYRSKTSIDRW